MKLRLLGTSGYHPSETRHTACLMLPEIGVVLDAGTGMFRVRGELQGEELDIFLTHPHLDHVIGLTYLFSTTYKKPLRRITVHGTAATLSAVRNILFAPAVFPAQPPMELHELAEVIPLAQGGRLTHFPLEHPGGATGFRLDWPERSLAYVTDTTATADADYVEKIRGVDVLVHVCYFNDSMPDEARLTGHSCTTPVAKIARAAGVKRLILTHINPLEVPEAAIDLSVAQAIFPQTELGEDWMEIEF